jgi:ribA/ribD-fused uncharacterized protein
MDIFDVESLKAAVHTGCHPEFLFFWGHTAKSTIIGKHVLSQWWPASFSIDGQMYPTAEHYMMAEKAKLFGDDQAYVNILATPSPSQAKALGRRVRGFDEKLWIAQRFPIAVRGNTAKFEQNTELKHWLMNTENLVLVEASPVDKVWGIGLAASDERALNPRSWRGLNLLGFALMKARGILKSGK